jgi:glycosyltransferase involved in cell wall biosynthesis
MSDQSTTGLERDPGRQRVLFVSYYFPPSGGPGVQRTLKFVKYLPEFGWDPVVLTVDPEYASYPAIDRELVAEVRPEVEVVRTRAWDPYSLYARILGKSKDQTVGVGFIDESGNDRRHTIGKWIRGNVFIPDARVGWVPFGVRAGRRLLKTHHFDAIVTTGPPHSTHLIGRTIADDTDIPWIADFRDPWTGIDFYDSLLMSEFSKRRDRKSELSVIRRADRVVAVTPGMVKALAKKADRPVELIMNGFDPDDIQSADSTQHTFVLSYVGNMNAARNPVALWKALRRLRDEAFQFGSFSVRLVGPIDRTVAESVDEYGIGDLVSFESPVSHASAVQVMLSSGMLLLVINRVEGSEGIMTGKLFEYIGSGRPVLGIGPPVGDAAEALRSSGAGRMYGWDDVDAIVAYLKESLDTENGRVRATGAHPDRRSGFSRRAQAGQLADLLKDVSSTKGFTDQAVPG